MTFVISDKSELLLFFLESLDSGNLLFSACYLQDFPCHLNFFRVMKEYSNKKESTAASRSQKSTTTASHRSKGPEAKSASKPASGRATSGRSTAKTTSSRSSSSRSTK